MQHSDDFTSVKWFGTDYTFDIGNRAKTIGLLWVEYEKGGLGLHEKTIGKKIDSANDHFRLAHVFRNHPAWNTMIQPISKAKGQFRLSPPGGITE